MSNNKQQTAVDKIVTLLNKKGFSPVLTEEEINFFKEVEKTAIIKSVNKGWKYHEEGFVSWMGEQYYNETYGGNK